MMRIGLFGGTFDPVHNGHVEVAKDVYTGLALEQIFFIPAAQPPHKLPVRIADAEDRLAMLRMALDGFSFFSASDVELRRSGPSYTIDTVQYFKDRYQRKADLMLIMGLDAFLEIDTWKAYKKLFKTIQIVVISRPSETHPEIEDHQQRIETYLRSAVSKDYHFSPEKGCFDQMFYQPVIPLAVRPMAISATMVRNRIATNQSIQHLVPDDVAAYIAKQGLYR